MIKKIKTTAMVLCFALAFSGVCGCGQEAAQVNETVDMDDPNEGLGDLIEDEEQPEEEPAVNVLALKGGSYTGLTNLTNQNNEDGTYLYEDMTEDGITVITNTSYPNSQRDGQAPDAYAQNFVCAIVDNDANVTDVKEDATLSSSLSYPAYRVYWESGSNEDSRQDVGVVVLTDSFTYYYGFGCPVDYYEENADFYESELDSVELIDLSELAAGEADEGAAEGSADEEGYTPYLDQIDELMSEGLANQFALAFIDDDDIPELIASDSEGSYVHENAFIFTINNDEVVLLASVIAGVDGGSLDYAEGSNLIHVSGAAAGMREVFSEIKDGKLEEVFKAEVAYNGDDAEYSVNGSKVDEAAYYEQINSFVEPYNPLTNIAYDGLYETTYKLEDGFGYFEQGKAEKYDTF